MLLKGLQKGTCPKILLVRLLSTGHNCAYLGTVSSNQGIILNQVDQSLLGEALNVQIAICVHSVR